MSQLKYISLHIKPLCDEIIKNPTIDVINNLNEELSKIENSYLQQFQDFILLPLIAQIEDYSVVVNKNELKTHLIRCITTMLSKTKLEKVVQFKTIVIILLKQIYEVSKGLVISNLSEEFKLSVIECIAVASQNIMTNILDEFYVEENSKFIAQIAHVCVLLLQNEKFRKLRVASINCLLAIFHLSAAADESDVVLREKISHIVFIRLPRIFTTLLRVTQEDDARGVSLKILAIKSIRLVLTLVFEDYNRQIDAAAGGTAELCVADFKTVVDRYTTNGVKPRSDDDILGIYLNTVKDPTARLQQLSNIKKTDEWFLAAARKLCNSFDLFVKLRSHPDKNLRYELALMNCDLIVKCAKNMTPCIAHYIETIITLSDDEHTEISTVCRRTIDMLFARNEYTNITVEIQNLFKYHLIKMPRIICRDDGQEIMSAITTLHSYVKILDGPKLKAILNDTDMLIKLIQILILLVEVDLKNTEVMLEEFALRDSNEIIHFDELNLPWKRFKHLNSHAAIVRVRDICKLLGNGLVSQLVFAHLLDMLEESRAESSEILILLNFCTSPESNRTILENVLDEYLKDYHWTLTIHNNVDLNLAGGTDRSNGHTQFYDFGSANGVYEGETRIKYTDLKHTDDSQHGDNLITIHDAKLHILHTCLITENTGNLSMAFSEHFHNYLFKTFHKFLEKAGSSNYLIHQSGMYALNKIRETFRVPRISDMIYSTSDYLIYHLKILFRKNEYNNVGLDILCVVLKYSSILLLPYLQIIVNDVLSQNLNARNDVTSYLKLLEMCVYALRKWKSENNAGNCDGGADRKLINGMDNLILKSESAPQNLSNGPVAGLKLSSTEENQQNVSNLKLWLSILETKMVEDCEPVLVNGDANDEDPRNANDDEEHHSDNEPNIEEPTANEVSLPNDIELTLAILKACVKFLGSTNKMNKLIVLRTINHGVELLKEHDDHLFPYIHEVWNQLAQRFLEKDLIIVGASLELVITLGCLSKDFIRQRAIKSVIPHLNTFLHGAAKDNLKNSAEINKAEYTQRFKLQNKMLHGYAKLIYNLEITDQQLDNILEVLKAYLNPSQPIVLQKNAKDCLHNLFLNYDATTILVKLSTTNLAKSSPFQEIYNRITKYNFE